MPAAARSKLSYSKTEKSPFVIFEECVISGIQFNLDRFIPFLRSFAPRETHTFSPRI